MNTIAYAATADNRASASPGITVKAVNTIGESISQAVIPVDPSVDWQGVLDTAEADALLRSNGLRRVFSWQPVRDTGLWVACVVPTDE